MKKKAYKLKIVLGKRQYRKGPSDSKMKSKLNEVPGYGAKGKKKAKKPSASAKRIKKIGRKLGS